eukprot:TRINITY_DN30131_c0_g1_i1.p1 TRINITY_DN30131_c0_g1~~TRINITY_DN30131_c0_g1_i1.p1  ORF type:complete len:337 (-),score=16.11 TRINITY_DN30131_c0_g1_i1:410-1420(-)
MRILVFPLLALVTTSILPTSVFAFPENSTPFAPQAFKSQSNGTVPIPPCSIAGYDLSPLASPTDYTAPETSGGTTYTFTFNICKEISADCGGAAGVASCESWGTGAQSCGVLADMAISGSPSTGVNITYSGGDGQRKTIITLLPGGDSLIPGKWTVTTQPDGITYTIVGKTNLFAGAPTVGPVPGQDPCDTFSALRGGQVCNALYLECVDSPCVCLNTYSDCLINASCSMAPVFGHCLSRAEQLACVSDVCYGNASLIPSPLPRHPSSTRSKFCLGGDDCDCAITSLGSICLLTVTVPALFVLLSMCMCFMCYRSGRNAAHKKDDAYVNLSEAYPH